MRISDVLEVGIPITLGVGGQRLRFTGYCKYLATGSADGIDDAVFCIAP